MVSSIVRYLHAARVPFHLASYPSPEPSPRPAHSLRPEVRPEALFVDTRLLIADGEPVIACYPASEQPDLAALAASLGSSAMVEGTSEALPDDFRYATGPVPPLGQLLGATVVIDDRVSNAGVLVFRAFSDTDFVEVPFDEFARLEQPRVAAFASAGELPAYHADHAPGP